MLVRDNPGCHDCPFREGGNKTFVPDEIIQGSPVLVMSQNPGEFECEGRKVVDVRWVGSRREYITEPHPPAPLLGPTGWDMERKFFPLAGLERGKVSLANPVRCRIDGGNHVPDLRLEVTKRAIDHCQRAHFKLPDSTRLIVAEGAYALYACTGEDGTGSPGHKLSMGIEGWRGYVLPWNPPPRPHLVHNVVWTPVQGEMVVLPTFHLAYLHRAPWYTPVSQRDWSKVQAILQGRWPEAPPDFHFDLTWPAKFAFDTEFRPDTGELIRYSLAHRNREGQAHVWCVEALGHREPVSVPLSITVGFHHVEADLESLQRLLFPFKPKLGIEDTMYLHALLWPDLDHDLDFVGSLYARTNRWKHLFRTNPRQYAGLDALGTWDALIPLSQELGRDPRVEHVYRTLQLPLAQIIHKARQHGERVIPERVVQALARMDVIQEEAELRAQSVTGWPLNLGSSAQVAAQLYSVEEVHLNKVTGRVLR